jgi:four helix bundle protein
MRILDFGIRIADLGLEDDVKGALKMNAEEMKTRTKEFAKDIINLCRKLPNNREGRLIGNQVFKSGTSVAANYRAACRGRSKAEFIAKLGIVEEEADETLFWLEIIEEMNIYDPSSVDSLMQECDEIIAIMVSSVKTAKRTRKQA